MIVMEEYAGYGVYRFEAGGPGLPAELPPPRVPDIARQMTEGVIGIGIAAMALGMVHQIVTGAITGPGMAKVAKELGR